jgi:Fe-S oxidoreductase
MWMEHEAGHRVNDVRMAEIEATGVSLAAVACPFCLIMLDEAGGAIASGGEAERQDIAEVLAKFL